MLCNQMIAIDCPLIRRYSSVKQKMGVFASYSPNGIAPASANAATGASNGGMI